MLKCVKKYGFILGIQKDPFLSMLRKYIRKKRNKQCYFENILSAMIPTHKGFSPHALSTEFLTNSTKKCVSKNKHKVDEFLVLGPFFPSPSVLRL